MRTVVGVTMAALIALGAAQAFAPRETPPLAASRLPMERLHLNTLVPSKAGLVTGGELGTLLVSSNQGKDWQRASVSTDRQALINQISFAPDGLEGMAVGHEGWILHTTDGGRSWKEVAFDEKNGEPLMSVARLPSGDWIAVGAFGRALRSNDAGAHWTRLALPGASIEDKHLNRIVGSADGQRWLIVGERGLVLRSDDGGESWAASTPFYNGSLYNAIALPDGGWLAYGMRGNVFRTSSADAPWSRSVLPVQASFFGHAVTPDGRVMLVGQGSVMATSIDGGSHFSLSRAQGRATLTDVLLQANGQGWITSDAGLQAFPSAPRTDRTTPSGAVQ